MQETAHNTTISARRKLWFWRFIVFILPILVIFLAIVGTAIMGALKPEPEKKEDSVKAIPVLTALAQSDDATLKVSAQGEVQPRVQINIVPQVGGKITYMSSQFIEGGQFRKGDLLVRINPDEYELRVVQARANVAQAETVLAREESEAAIAKQDWDELGSNKEATPLILREPQMAEAAASLEAAKAALAEAELQLSRTALYAPFNGRVTQRHIDPGEFVGAGTRLGEVYATDVMDVRLPLTHQDLRQAGLSLGYAASKQDAGVPVTLSADVAGRFSQWKGHIVRTDSRFDTQTRVLFAYVEVRDPFGAGSDEGTPLAPGLFVDAEISGKQLSDIVTIPRSALRGEGQVYIAKADNTLEIKPVSVLSTNRQNAILSRGLEPGTAVITSPIRGVADGMKIEPVTTQAAASEDTQGETP